MNGLDLQIMRIRAGIKQKDLADALDIDAPSLCRIEQKVCVDPKLINKYTDTLEKMLDERESNE